MRQRWGIIRFFFKSIYIGLIILTISNDVWAIQETVGRTYDIFEKDAAADFEDEAKKIDWEKIMKKKREQNIKKYQPKDLTRLPRVDEPQKYLVDMSYTLEMDIPDGKGGILYPKGYTFNPLLFVPPYTGILVVIDPTDEDQISWYERSEYSRNFRTRLFICEGAHHEVSKRLKQPVYYLNKVVADRLQLVAAPSVVQQNGAYMEVEQVDVTKKTSK